MKEYEAAVSSLRRDIVMFKEAQILGRENADKIHEVSNPPRMLEKLFSLKRLKISSIYDSLPHLLDYEEALTPALTLGKDREGGKRIQNRLDLIHLILYKNKFVLSCEYL